MSFHDTPSLFQTQKPSPLAYRLSPSKLEDYVGQQHLLGPKGPIRRMIERKQLLSMILWGRPGCGKTSLARLLSISTQSHFVALNAVTGSISDLKKIQIEATHHASLGQSSLLFIDEIHRFTKTQQDVLLPSVESGLLTLIGATTENPFFSVISGLISRCHIFELHPLQKEDLETLTQKATQNLGLTLSQEAIDWCVSHAQGDARSLLNIIELAHLSSTDTTLSVDYLNTLPLQTGQGLRDDDHYDLISAYIKSMRGSDPDAALYFLAQLLHQGEDPLFIVRRLLIFASEDIGNADPHALVLASALLETARFVGMPEIRIPLSQVTTYFAAAPKSNAAYVAINQALQYVKTTPYSMPEYLRDSHRPLSAEALSSAPYLYPHDYEHAICDQVYAPGCPSFYTPSNRGYEASILKRLDYYRSLKNKGGLL